MNEREELDKTVTISKDRSDDRERFATTDEMETIKRQLGNVTQQLNSLAKLMTEVVVNKDRKRRSNKNSDSSGISKKDNAVERTKEKLAEKKERNTNGNSESVECDGTRRTIRVEEWIRSNAERKEANEPVIIRIEQPYIPKSGRLMNFFEEPSFTGNKDGKNPARFVEQFERVAEYEKVPDYD